METTITDEQRAAIRAALHSPDLTLVKGTGSAGMPGVGRACTIAEINLVLTGVLDAGQHPCIDEVIRHWVIRVQDAMPDEIRNSPEWRAAAVGIAGSADGSKRQARRAVLMEWMWQTLADEAVVAGVPVSARPAWGQMLTERTQKAAHDAAKAAYAVAAANAVAAAGAAADAAAYAVATSVAYADVADVADHAAYVVAYDDRADYWRRRDMPATLTRLINP